MLTMNEHALNGFERAYLRRLAHHRHPLVSIGRQGYTPAVAKALAEALCAHELVKVKFQDCKDLRHELCVEAAKESGADLVGLVGNIGIFFKISEVEEFRTIILPGKKAHRA